MPRCQFPIFCYFVFQKSYTGNILGIGGNEARTSYFFRCETKSEGESEEARDQPHHRVVHPLARATTWCGGPGPPLTSPLRLYKVSVAKTLKQLAFSPVKFRSTAAIKDQFQGTELSIPAPCQDEEVSPKPSPSTPLMSTHASVLVDSVGPPSAEVCRAAASFP
jgi:hypothetical protein